MLRFFIRIFGSNFSFFGKRNILITFPPKSPKEIKYTKNSEEKGRFMRFVHRFTRKSFEYFESFEYFYHLNAKALITNWVTFEIDKTVSTFYFLSILCYISFLLIYNPYTYLNNLSHIFNTSNQTFNTSNQTFNTSNQTLKTGKNLGCKDNNCLPININALREAILFATIATGVVARCVN